MHRFYLPPDEVQDAKPVLRGREANHALHVLRLRPGDRLAVLDGVGHEFLCQASERQGEALALEILEQHDLARPPWRLTLLQALPKGKIIESIIQKATELGVARVVPLLSERVVYRLDIEGARQKAEKWQWVAIEAIKQCGAAWLPIIEPPLGLNQYLERKEPLELSLVGSLQGDREHPRRYFRQFEAAAGRKPGSVGVWVGPEGDFTPQELGAIRAGGALPISLGDRVLRSETAAIYCLSIINYELQAPVV